MHKRSSTTSTSKNPSTALCTPFLQPQDSVHQAIRNVIEHTPHSIAIQCDGQTMCYAQLKEETAYWVRHFRDLGIQPHEYVGLSFGRNPQIIPSILALFELGAAYIPLDPTWPTLRIQTVIDDAKLRYIVTDREDVSELHRQVSCSLLVLNTKRQLFLHLQDTNTLIAMDSESSPIENKRTDESSYNDPYAVAYMMYTSGSTGKPKGVEVEHRSIMNVLYSYAERMQFSPSDHVCSVLSASFDLSVLDFFLPLIHGATLELAPQDTLWDGQQLASLLEREAITWMQATPSTFRMLLENKWKPSTPIQLLSGGESLPLDLARQLVQLPQCRLWNGYGITETTIQSTLWECPTEPTQISIGSPIRNTPIYILDPAQQPVSKGKEGEIFIGGLGVARGYKDQPTRTQERFLPDPFSDQANARMYRTGDLGYQNEEGELICLGRIDHQVKLRGFRIELGEIEAQLRMQTLCKDAVVSTFEGTTDTQLVAYVLLHEEHPSWKTNIHQELSAWLPTYMLPAAYVHLDAFPLTTSGKIDRKALPAPSSDDRLHNLESSEEPLDSIEHELCEWWNELLPQENLNRHQNFFFSGGTSLVAARWAARIREQWNIDLPVSIVLQAPTPAHLANAIRTACETPKRPVLRAVHSTEPIPLSFAQERLWFIHQLDPHSTEYNTSLLYTWKGDVDVERIQQAFRRIVERHTILRTHFPQHDGAPVQQITPMEHLGSIDCPSIDVSGLPPALARQQIQSTQKHFFSQPFQLAQGPLYRCMLIRTEQQTWQQLLSFHHILTDGWSHRILLDELIQQYTQLQTGEEPQGPLDIQYTDLSLWQHQDIENQHKYSLSFWKQQLSDAPALLALPSDRERPKQRSTAGAEVTFALSAQQTERLQAFAQHHQSTVFSVAFSAFSAWFAQETGQYDLPIGTFVANRPHRALETMIGYFSNTIVLRSEVQLTKPFQEHLACTQRMLWSSFEHQELPFNHVVQALQPERDHNGQPLFQVCFVHQEPPHLTRRIESSIELSMDEYNPGTSPFDVLVQFWEASDHIQGHFTYRTDLFEHATVEAWVQRYLAFLQGCITQPTRPLYQHVTPSPKNWEQKILQQDGVQDCVVLPIPLQNGCIEHVAYIQSQTPRMASQIQIWLQQQLEKRTVGTESIPTHCVRVSRIPRDGYGHPPFSRLQALPFFTDTELKHQTQQLQKQFASIESIQWERTERRPERQVVHQWDLLEPRQIQNLHSTAQDIPQQQATDLQEEFDTSTQLSLREGPPLEMPKQGPIYLSDVLYSAAQHAPEKGVTCIEWNNSISYISYPELVEQAEAIASGLHTAGLRKGDIVILQLRHNRDFIPALWGGFIGGYVVLPLAVPPAFSSKNAPLDKLLGIWEMLDYPSVIGSEDTVEGCLKALHTYAQSTAQKDVDIRVHAIQQMRQAAPLQTKEPASRSPEDLTLLLLTSGSTGLPKAVCHHHTTILSFLEAYKQQHAFSSEDVFLNWLGLDHVAPLFMCHLSSVYNHSEGVHAPFAHFINKPSQCLDWVEQYKATSTFLPNFAFGLINKSVEAQPSRSWDLSTFTKITNGGEAIVAKTARRFLQLLEPHGLAQDAMLPIWGMSETSSATITSKQFSRDNTHDTDTFVSIGDPVPGFAMRIVDASDQLVPEGVEGRLQVRGAMVMSAYYQRPKANAEAFTDDGWFDTGDLAFIDAQGMTITGRSKDVIIIHGTNYYSHEIEAAAESVSGTLRSFIAACAVRPPGSETDQIAVVFCVDPNAQQPTRTIIQAVQNAVTRQIGITPFYVLPVEPDAIPKTEIGKLQRVQLKKRFEEGYFAEVIRSVDRLLRNERTLPDWSFRQSWNPAALPIRSMDAVEHIRGPKNILFFAPQNELCTDWSQQWDAQGHTVHSISRTTLSSSEVHYSHTDAVEHWYRFFQSFKTPQECPTTWIHAWNVDAQIESTPASIAYNQQLGTYTLLAVLQGYKRYLNEQNASEQSMRLIFISPLSRRHTPTLETRNHFSQETSTLTWSTATLQGIASTLHHEHPTFRALYIEWDGSPSSTLNADTLLHEEDAMQLGWNEVTYSQNTRLTPVLQRIDWSMEQQTRSPFKAGQMLVITGGLGGIGVHLSQKLLKEYGCKLLLIGRSALQSEAPETDRMQRWKMVQRAAQTSSHETAECAYEICDLTQPKALLECVHTYEQKWQCTIQGIVHLASTLRDVPLHKESTEGLDVVFDAKLWSASAFETLLQARTDVFWIDFGSVNGLWGGWSAGAYAAGSRAGQAFTHSLREQGHEAYHITWSTWDDTGMTKGIPSSLQAERRGYLPISVEEGLHFLWACLHRQPADWIIGLDPTHPIIRGYMQEKDITLDAVTLQVQSSDAALDPTWPSTLPCRQGAYPLFWELAAKTRPVQQRAHIEASTSSTSTALEQHIAEIWKDVLVLQDVGVEQSFFDLGGHSILLAQLQEKMERSLEREIPILTFFRHPTIRTLAQHLEPEEQYIDPAPSKEELLQESDPDTSLHTKEVSFKQSKAPSIPRTLESSSLGQISSEQHSKQGDISDEVKDDWIAIVGMAGRFPGASDLAAFWKQLIGGVEGLTRFTPEELREVGIPEICLQHPDFVPVRGFIEGTEEFDAPFFQMSPRQAELTDPQQRLFLESAWNCLEDAACDPERWEGSIGVFAGCSANTYLLNNLLSDRVALASMGGSQALLSSDKDHLATLAAYKLNLHGPAVTVQTACSTSLVALHMACQSLWQGDCDMALVGAASIAVPYKGGHLYRTGHIFSSDGHCKAFDAEAEGTVSGDGVGVIAIRKLSDALASGDPIRAVIRGIAINNDGNQKMGYTAPSVDAQSDAVAQAHANAGISADSIGYVEAHGTGTALGDPIEVTALSQAFRQTTQKTGFCALGSVKSNIGHLNTAAGMAGLIKSILALEHQWLPPSLHFKRPNTRIPFAQTPFFVNTQSRPWVRRDTPLRAGVSSFGAGGTNAHVVLEEALTWTTRPSSEVPVHKEQESILLPLSARSSWSVQEQAKRLGEYLYQQPQCNLADVAYTLQKGRSTFEYRKVVVARNVSQAAQALHTVPDAYGLHVEGFAPPSGRNIAFICPAQGTQRIGMAQQLYRWDASFRHHMDACFAILDTELDISLRDILYPDTFELHPSGELDDQRRAGPAVFSVSYALGKMWMERGIQPDVLIGHSTGEYVAACLSGVLSLRDALHILVRRAEWIDTMPKGRGVYLTRAPEDIRPYLDEEQYIAVINGPQACVVTGEHKAIDRFVQRLEEHGLAYRNVRISGPAHTPLFAPIADALEDAVQTCTLNPPQIPIISGITGEILSAEEACDPQYWSRHLTQPVDFCKALATLQARGQHVCVELGPARCLRSTLQLNQPDTPVLSSVPHHQDSSYRSAAQIQDYLLARQAQFWTEGCKVELPQGTHSGRALHLPTYPFEHKTYWIDPKPGTLPTLANLGEEELDWSNSSFHSEQPSEYTGGRVGSVRESRASGPQRSTSKHPRPQLATPFVAPHTQAEQWIIELISDLLGIEGIGIHDAFIDLGADSLITLRIVHQLDEKHGIQLPQAAAFAGLTAHKMAQFVERAVPTETLHTLHSSAQVTDFSDIKTAQEQGELPDELDELLIPLRTTGSRPPLFLVHPASGVIFPYITLAQQLGDDQPVYAIQARGLDGQRTFDRTCEAMAERYIPLMRHVQPEGPYHLAAFSFGSYVVYEMALQLQKQGQETAFLGLIDEFVPLDGLRTQWMDVIRVFSGRSGYTFTKHFRDYMALGRRQNERAKQNDERPLHWLRDGWRKRYWKNVFERTVMTALLPPETHSIALTQPAMKPMFDLFLLHAWLTFRYTPEPYDGHATLFKSEWTADAWHNRRKHTTDGLGWEKLILGTLDIRPCSGGHLDMIRPPHVQRLAHEIRAAMDQAIHTSKHSNTGGTQ